MFITIELLVMMNFLQVQVMSTTVMMTFWIYHNEGDFQGRPPDHLETPPGPIFRSMKRAEDESQYCYC